MNDCLIKAENSDEFFTGERCHITELCNRPEVPESSLAIARVEPGVTTQLHSLANTKEVYIVIEGSGLMEVEGSQFEIVKGDKVVISAGQSQRVTANEDSELRFYCLCTPRFEPKVYVNLEG